MAETVAAGARLRDVAGRIVLEGDTVRTEGLEGGLFGGRFRGEVEVGVLVATLPVGVSMRLKDLDLEVLTEEMQPGDVKLTGLASGAMRVRFSTKGLAALHLELKSTEGFTLDRETVRQILLANATGGISAGKQLSRVAEKVVGTASRRPFQSATLTVRLTQGAIQWRARLESPDLNLTVDSDRGLDPGELYRALGRWQALELEKLDKVHAESVDFGE